MDDGNVIGKFDAIKQRRAPLPQNYISQVEVTVAAPHQATAWRRTSKNAALADNDALERARALVGDDGFAKVCAVVPGGARRQDSVRAGLEALGRCDWVVVHDGARPLVTEELIERGLEEARETGASCCALPVPDTVKEGDEAGHVVRTLDRSRLWLAQTPQVFSYELLLKAHQEAEGEATDDAALVEALGVKVLLYRGSPRNLKVTTQEDLALVEALLAQSS
ncbi:MAG: 2-C-methyl-D-erythritol 4-phosphate cytidylyltransferase [Chloroflexi bacterium]|nr:2-C-methyl-D-erythritol 4-phosphate cytidylyltransferase [Chloroflexota bacterium]